MPPSTATAPPPPAKAPKKADRPLVPPPDAFWQRYSPHHEAPLSMGGSLVIHLVIIGLILLVGLTSILDILGLDKRRPMEIGAVSIATNNTPDAGGNSAPKQENVGEPSEPQLSPEVIVTDPPKLPTPTEVPPDIKVNPEAIRIVETPEAREAREKVEEQLRKYAQANAAKKPAGGEGTTDKGQTGKGSPQGEGTGPGTQRGERASRWVMSFETQSGDDYLRQLTGLGAILAVPLDGGTRYTVYRNLKARPVPGRVEDVSKLNRIYWVDNNPESLVGLAQAMGLASVPPLIVAFFPEELEKALLAKELAFGKQRGRIGEGSIKKTQFRIVKRGGRYEVYVAAQE